MQPRALDMKGIIQRFDPILCAIVVSALASIRLVAATSADEEQLRQAARLRGLAQADMEDANYGRAVEALEELASILPHNILPPINLAICYFRLNEPQRALDQIRRAQAIDPDNPQMLFALARILEQQSEAAQEWREVIDHFETAHPRDPRPLFLRGEVAASRRDWSMAMGNLGRASRLDPENLVLLTELMVAGAEAGDAATTLDAVDALEDRLNGFEGSMLEFAETIRQAGMIGDTQAMRPAALVLRNLLRPQALYQLGLIPLTGGQQPGGQLFPQLDFNPPLPKSIQGGQDIDISVLEVTDSWGRLEPAPVLALAHAPGELEDGLIAATSQGVVWGSWQGGSSTTETLRLSPPPVAHLLHHDLDQDDLPDIVGTDRAGTVYLYRGVEAGGFADGESLLTPDRTSGLSVVAPVDIDHDGDLDLFIGRPDAGDLYLENRGSSGWTERANELAIAGGSGDTSGVVSADFDDDGDLDLLVSDLGRPPSLYLNRRAGPLAESAAAWGLQQLGIPSRGVRAADFDSDGVFDVVLWSADTVLLLRSTGSRFEPLQLPPASAQDWRQVVPADFDNDGDQDLLMASAEPAALWLLRNRRTHFTFEPLATLPEPLAQLLTGDFDSDGDLDVATRAEGGELGLWSNAGGNRNQWVRLRLKGRTDNNSKNNSEGLFTHIEVRLGDAFQALAGNGGINHIGLGAAQQADVIRVVWTNGLAQTWLRVGANRTLVEEQVLKGSCPFLYTWNGEEFTFVTDLMWRSPLGMILADGSAAPHQSARDFVLIPGDKLQPAGNQLWLQITEELWEAVYLDRLELIAIDHPADRELVVDETFRPPPHPHQPPVHWIGQRSLPSAAVDHAGRNVLAEIVDRDERYVGDLPLSRYQGLTTGHSLDLTFEEVPAGAPLTLVLWGWIFPTDTTINFALSQDNGENVQPPSLWLRDAAGRWQLIEPFIGFPNGKRKAVVVALGERLSGPTATLRISTNMQIYWDAAILAAGQPPSPSTWTRLDPVAADLHYRGYSLLYRESTSGPHLFDYSRVEIGPRFRDLAGRYTRFGPVDSLLGESDDRYVVMNAGDEMTVRFDASALPPLPADWRRDWILFSDGWVKDGDIHTTRSQTVEPLPYHGMSSYPDWPDHRYPTSQGHLEYLKGFQTRVVDDRPFRLLLRRPPLPLDDAPLSD